jgi:hypothetical protein
MDGSAESRLTDTKAGTPDTLRSGSSERTGRPAKYGRKAPERRMPADELPAGERERDAGGKYEAL